MKKKFDKIVNISYSEGIQAEKIIITHFPHFAV